LYDSGASAEIIKK